MTTIDTGELAKFAAVADDWWDVNGKLRTLHDINPIRVDYVRRRAEISGARILDVGCGGGILSEELAKRGGLVTGLDAEESAIVAAKRHQGPNGKIRYLQMDIKDYYPEEQFDIITCMEMLEHVDRPEIVIAECSRLLKPGGKFIVSTINRTLHAFVRAVVLAEYFLKILPPDTHDYGRFLKPAEIAAVARKCGMTTIDLRGMYYEPFGRRAWYEYKVDVNYLMAFEKRVTADA